METNSNTIVTKANGERENFNPVKLYRSLVRSGADARLADTITSTIASSIREGDNTKNIYRKAFSELRRIERPMAARYSVKHALLELGPSGYPFEDYLSEIYKELGYRSTTRRTVQGRCIDHELDIIATRGTERLGAEIKFHNNTGVKSDIKVALYVHARFEDIAAQSGKGSETDFTDRLLITNTKFTKQVEMYAACVGLQILSWDYPAKGNLRELIEKTRLHPVSCLTTLSRMNKRRLMEKGTVLCRQIPARIHELEALGLSKKAIGIVLQEIHDLCHRTDIDDILD
jgi:hypothetical protein